MVEVIISGSGPYAIVAVLFAGAVGAVIAATAGFGSLIALLVFDHWGERSPTYRALIAALGAAVACLGLGEFERRMRRLDAGEWARITPG
jgi:hypothetical protein